MTSRLVRLLLGLAGALCSLPASSETRWFAIYLGDSHIGHLQRERHVQAGTIETRNSLSLVLQRGGELLRVESAEVHRETLQGEPLAFSSRFATGGTLAEVSGEVRDGQAQVTIKQGGQHSERSLPWPRAALLAEGQRRALLGLLDPQRPSVEILAFDPASLSALPLYSERLHVEPASAEPGAPALVHVSQIHGNRDGGMRSELWLQADGSVARMKMPALGLELMLHACDAACATAPPEAADILASTLLSAPRALSRRDREQPLVFRLRAGDAALDPLARIPGQSLRKAGDEAFELEVDPAGGDLRPPVEADLSPGRWLQSDDPAVRAMADEAVGRTRSESRRMQRLEAAVRRHITHKSLRVGYASAAEVIELREGDCTEHAVLLAALARAVGIPARVVTGLAYAPGYGGRNDVFVPHAWVMAWIDGRWRGFDAALPAFGSAHIGLSMGNGEPFDFYGGLELLGRLELIGIAPRGSADRG